MTRGNNLGKSIILIFLIIILCLAGLLWFDYLGIVRAKSVFSPVYRLFGKKAQTSTTVTSSRSLSSDIDQDRIDKQREALLLMREELDKRESDLVLVQQQHEQMATELSEREKYQDEREKTLNLTQKKYDDKNANVEQIAINLMGMQPRAAVDILVGMDDQLVIDVLRKAEEISQRNNTMSFVAYWLSLMPSDRAAEIERKTISKPLSLD